MGMYQKTNHTKYLLLVHPHLSINSLYYSCEEANRFTCSAISS